MRISGRALGVLVRLAYKDEPCEALNALHLAGGVVRLHGGRDYRYAVKYAPPPPWQVDAPVLYVPTDWARGLARTAGKKNDVVLRSDATWATATIKGTTYRIEQADPGPVFPAECPAHGYELAPGDLAKGGPIAGALGVVGASAPEKWRGLLYFLVAAPLLVNTVVRTYGWLLILGRKGLVNQSLMETGLIDTPVRFLGTELGILIGMVYILLPFIVLAAGNALAQVDPAFEQASEDLGASPRATFLP